MAKTKKNTQNQPRRKRLARVPIPRALKLTPTGASLAAYHAALSDPFSSPPTFIPTGSRPGTFVHKRLITHVASAGHNYFCLKLWSQSATAWKITAFDGTNGPQNIIGQVISNPGKVRIVGAAVRVSDIGRADSLGGIAACVNASTQIGTNPHVEQHLYKRSVTSYFKPVFASDFTWYSGNDANGNDDFGNIQREVIVTIDGAVDTKSFVEFVVLFENDELMAPIEGAANYLVGRRAATTDSGPATKHIARHASTNHKQRELDMRNHNKARGPTYIQRLTEGVRAAAETGATVMGVVETLSPGSVSGPFKEYLGLGQATESEMMGAAADSLPLLEAAMDFTPMALL